MKKFAFSLQAALNVKYSVEKAQKAEMAVINRRIYLLNNELSEYNTQNRIESEKLKEETKKGISPSKLNEFNNFFTFLKEKIKAVKENIKKAEEEKEEIRARMIKTMQEIKSFEKLKEKQYEDYLVELRRDEEKNLGDIVSHKLISH